MREVGGLGCVVLLGVLVGSSSCGSSSPGSNGQAGKTAGGAAAGGSSGSSGASSGSAPGGVAGADEGGSGSGEAGSGEADSGEAGMRDLGGAGGATDDDGDVPATCDAAAQLRSHLGCEFWPTLVSNPVWSEFSPGLVLSNSGKSEASVEITGPGGFHETLVLAPRQTERVLLEWVPLLKGPEWAHPNTSGGRAASSTLVPAGAYKVVSSTPIAAWQFNPLVTELAEPACNPGFGGTCRAANGDASLLVPVTSLTGNYRVLAMSTDNGGPDWGSTPGAFAVTATRDGTKVHVQMAPHCGAQKLGTSELGACTAAGSAVASKAAGEVYTFDMNAGDVVTLVGAPASEPRLMHADVSGSVVNANHPVQVIAFVATASIPDSTIMSSDHLEETVPPAESFGNKYVVMPPSAPVGSVGHAVRIYGNVDGTVLNYPNGKPAGAPDVINAGEVVQFPPLPEAPNGCANTPPYCLLSAPFTVEGSQGFGVASFLPGGTLFSPIDGLNSQGDPAATWIQAPEQFRRSYVLTALDTTTRFADVLAPSGAKLFLDGTLVTSEATFTIAGWEQHRLPLTEAGFHELTTDAEQGMSVQVLGYSLATGYYYPAGGNFKLLSQPPLVIP